MMAQETTNKLTLRIVNVLKDKSIPLIPDSKGIMPLSLLSLLIFKKPMRIKIGLWEPQVRYKE
jgi:hypothetical protein